MRKIFQRLRGLVLNVVGSRRRARILLVGVFVIAVTLLLPRSSSNRIQFRPGQAWQQPTLVAPFTFPIRKPEHKLQQDRQAARDAVPRVFLALPDHLKYRLEELELYFDQLQEAIQQGRAASAYAWEVAQPEIARISAGLQPAPNMAALKALWRRPIAIEELRQAAAGLAQRLYAQGFIDLPIAELRNPFVALRTTPSEEVRVEARGLLDRESALREIQTAANRLNDVHRPWWTQLLSARLTPNYRFSIDLYEQDLEAALANVSPNEGLVQRGEAIVEHRQTVGPRVATVLESYNAALNERATRSDYRARLLGQFLLTLLITLVVMEFLRINRREVFFRIRHLTLLFAVYLFTIALVLGVLLFSESFTAEYALDYYLVIPVAMAPILLTVFFDDRIGFISNIGVALLGSLAVQNSFTFFTIHALAGAVAVFNLRLLRNRRQFFTMTGTLGLAYVGAYVGLQLFQLGDWQALNPQNLVLIGLNVFLTLGTYPLIYLFERVFRITSNLTYMELLDTDHPLLKEMAIKAPGTYQHSLAVAHIAEEVAKKVGGNPILLHAGALFHDIGKTENAPYFVENMPAEKSPHKELSPLKSAKVIIRHVADGVKLAEEHNLPTEFLDFIRTHHGTTRVDFFYREYLKRNPNAREDIEEDFRYKGPKPSTKEEAILMIVDSIEAAARALPQPTPESLSELVDRIVDRKISDNQLNLARLTFRDLNKIKRETFKLLLSIYHARIEYPDNKSEPEN